MWVFPRGFVSCLHKRDEPEKLITRPLAMGSAMRLAAL